MNYNEVVAAWQNLLVTPSSEIDFLTLVPRAIEASELRIYRVMDFLYTIKSETSTLAAPSRNVTVPTDMIIIRSANVISPYSQTSPDVGTRNPLTRVTNEYLDAVYPSPSVTGTPQYYAMLTDTSCLVGPTPDQNYTVEFVGTYRPTPLSPVNTSTFLTTNMPDLFVASGMIYWSSLYQQPEMAAYWQKLYDDYLAGISIETMRQKAASVGWTPYQPTPAANTPRSGA